MSVDALLARVRAQPRDAVAAIDLADAAIKAGREEEAAPLVARAAKAAGSNPRLWQWTALMLRALDDHAAALPWMERAAALAPADKSILHGRARIHFEVGLPATALFHRVLQVAPGDGEVLLGHAAARLAEGDVTGAEDELASLLRQSPAWLPGHHALVQLRSTYGDRAGFTRGYEDALRATPRNADLWRALIIALIHAGEHGRALAAVDRARAAIGGQTFLDANEAVIHSEEGDVAAADAAFARVPPLRDVSLALRRIRHALRTARLEAALVEIEAWLGTPEMELVWPYAATAWTLAGDPRRDWLERDGALIGVFDLADRLPELERLRGVVAGLHRAQGEQIDQSVRGGVQTDGLLLARLEPELRALRAAIGDAVRAHVAALPPPDPSHPTLRARRDRRPRLSGSWSVRLRGGGFHANHAHPAGWLSSAFYLTLPDAGGSDPEAGWIAFGGPPAELGLDVAPFRSVEPQPGRLVLFPSTLWHGTRPFAAGERMTVAFDVRLPL